MRRLLWLAGLATLVILALWRLSEHDLNWRTSEPFDINGLTGTLWLPETPRAALVLVHGDGPQDRSASDGYAPLIHHLLDQGLAVASWDKPGVGGSKGDWLTQTMADRATETRAALAELSRRFPDLPTGALGFSQAGWVLPRLTPADADFLVLVGPAVSWAEQSAYYTRTRLTRAGLNGAALEAERARIAAEDARAFAPNATAADAPAGMSPARWRFVKQAQAEDARPWLARLRIPTLALWGADDLNVDAQANAAAYRALSTATIHVIPNATHGLLRAPPYNWQLTQTWPVTTKLRFVIAGRRAFAPGALDLISDWVLTQSPS